MNFSAQTNETLRVLLLSEKMYEFRIAASST